MKNQDGCDEQYVLVNKRPSVWDGAGQGGGGEEREAIQVSIPGAAVTESNMSALVCSLF